jgi:hypothetical protein
MIAAIRAFLVIPETPQALSGILTDASVRNDPVSATHGFALHCARDDRGKSSGGKAL